MLENNDIARLLSHMKGKDGNPCCKWWNEGTHLNGKAVGRMRLRLGLLNSETICGVRCARFEDTFDQVVKDREYWPRILTADV